jgi:hypothetical protein
MIDDSALHKCRVCGLDFGDSYFPWGEDGESASFDICPCCGCEFGYEDVIPTAARNHRQRWLAGGAQWRKPKERPIGWSAERQLQQIAQEFC